MNLKPGFSRFLGAAPERLHFAAHSHHPWPDVSFEAHQESWLDAARLMDDKWEHIFGTVIPDTQKKIASTLGLSDPATLTFAPNTHAFLTRLFSCLEPPVRVLTTDAEFHSFHRQSRRWEEAGLAIVDRIPAEPFDTFADRFTREARAGVHDLVYLSQVFFDSGFVVPDLDRVVSSVSEDRAFVVIDGYHGFMARPTNLGAIQDRVFFLAGGYKYAMAGEGACFLHSPPGYGPRPIDTGWYAGFGQLETGISSQIPYAEDGSRFSGSTYDPSGIYRMRAVLAWLEESGVTVAGIRAHVVALQNRLLANASLPGELIPPSPHARGNFLTFKSETAGDTYRALHERGVITDYRGDRLRFGFGIYQDEADVDRLVGVLAGL
ncbi:MAG: aminotransferase class V-fold PLP-dependent enzyme [Acidimicrobiia bacterium]